jgi:hypothetical protein
MAFSTGRALINVVSHRTTLKSASRVLACNAVRIISPAAAGPTSPPVRRSRDEALSVAAAGTDD